MGSKELLVRKKESGLLQINYVNRKNFFQTAMVFFRMKMDFIIRLPAFKLNFSFDLSGIAGQKNMSDRSVKAIPK